MFRMPEKISEIATFKVMPRDVHCNNQEYLSLTNISTAVQGFSNHNNVHSQEILTRATVTSWATSLVQSHPTEENNKNVRILQTTTARECRTFSISFTDRSTLLQCSMMTLSKTCRTTLMALILMSLESTTIKTLGAACRGEDSSSNNRSLNHNLSFNNNNSSNNAQVTDTGDQELESVSLAI